MSDTKPKLVTVTVAGSLPLDEYRAFRAQSALEGLRANAAVALAVREWLAARGKIPEVSTAAPTIDDGENG